MKIAQNEPFARDLKKLYQVWQVIEIECEETLEYERRKIFLTDDELSAIEYCENANDSSNCVNEWYEYDEVYVSNELLN